MQSNNIIILDDNNDNSQFFDDQFSVENYKVEILTNLHDVSAKVAGNIYKLILIDYSTLASCDRADIIEMFKKIKENHLIVYRVPDLANRRLAFYDLGALRVYDDSLSLNEVFFSLRGLLKTMNSSDESTDYSVGKLEDIPLATLIKIFGKENRTGVLKVITNLNSGKIYFVQGDVDQAQVGFHTGDRAILHMLFWKSGSFSFTSTDIDIPAREISVSNIGLLLLAERLRKEYIVHLGEIGPANCVIRIKNIGDLLAYGTKYKSKFVKQLERPQTLEEIIENPHYTSFETAEILVHFKRQGFIFISEPSKQLVDDIESGLEQEVKPVEKVKLSQEDSEKLVSILQIEDQHSSKLMIFGSHSSGKTQFVNALSNSKKPVKSEQDLDLGHLLVGTEIDIFLLGVRINKKAIEIMQKISEGVSGYIFLIEASNDELFGYTNYLINYLTALNNVPWTVAITGADEGIKIKKIQEAFTFPTPVEFSYCDTNDIQSIKNTLLSLQCYQAPQEEEEKELEEEEIEEIREVEEEDTEEEETVL